MLYSVYATNQTEQNLIASNVSWGEANKVANQIETSTKYAALIRLTGFSK